MRKRAEVALANPPPVIVRNLQRTLPVPLKLLRSFAPRAVAACAALSGSRRFPAGELAVLFISDRRMSALHLEFMGVPGPTDVITFQHGEIFISVETAKRQARHFGSSLINELQLYILHGLLHLRGYDDTNPAGARRMGVLQERILWRIAALTYSPKSV